MRRLRQDIKDVTQWKRCVLKAIPVYVTRNVNGSVYINPWDLTKSVSDENTPYLFTDRKGAYWTGTLDGLQEKYVLPNGEKLDEEFIEELEYGKFRQVFQRGDLEFWYFKVDVNTYKWDCPFGANVSGSFCETGDYLVTEGNESPDTDKLRMVPYHMFVTYYEERGKVMPLRQEGSVYYYGDKKFESFHDALVEMMWHVTWEGAEIAFEGINTKVFGNIDKIQYLLLRALLEWDIFTLFEVYDYATYQSVTQQQIAGGEDMLTPNPLFTRNLSIPMVYQDRVAVQQVMLPVLKLVYDKAQSSVYCKNGKYPDKVVLSYMLDKYLFAPEYTPFKEIVGILYSLEQDPRTAGLAAFMKNGDLPNARILAMQVRVEDLTGESKVLLSNLKRMDYPCRTQKVWGGNDYAEIMYKLPPSMVSDDYFAWLYNAGMAVGKQLIMVRRKPVEKYIQKVPQIWDLDLSIEYEPEPVVEKVIPKLKPEREPKPKLHTISKVGGIKSVSEILGIELSKEELDLLSKQHPAFMKNPNAYINSPRLQFIKKWILQEREQKDEKTFVSMERENNKVTAKPVLADYGSMEMYEATVTVCATVGESANECIADLQAQGFKEWETLYRMMLTCIINKHKDVSVTAMTQYMYKLHDVYGSCKIL